MRHLARRLYTYTYIEYSKTHRISSERGSRAVRKSSNGKWREQARHHVVKASRNVETRRTDREDNRECSISPSVYNIRIIISSVSTMRRFRAKPTDLCVTLVPSTVSAAFSRMRFDRRHFNETASLRNRSFRYKCEGRKEWKLKGFSRTSVKQETFRFETIAKLLENLRFHSRQF